MVRPATSMTKNALRIRPGDTTGRPAIPQSRTTPAAATIPKEPSGGRITAAKPTTTPKAIDATAQATIGTSSRRTLCVALLASLVSAMATKAIWDRAKRFPMRGVISVELPNAALRLRSSPHIVRYAPKMLIRAIGHYGHARRRDLSFGRFAANARIDHL